jgi:hypothetical protein
MKTFMNITNYRSKSSNPMANMALPTTSAMPVSTAATHATNPQQRHSANGQSKPYSVLRPL